MLFRFGIALTYTIFAPEMRKIIIYILFVIIICGTISAAKKTKLAPSYAWTITNPLGERYLSTVDTLQYNYYQQAIPSMVSNAYATTGNLGAEGQNQIFFDRGSISEFFFEDALSAWLPSIKTQKYYNTRIPMTLLSYNTGGDKNSVQDRLRATFSGNVNRQIEIGAALDYLYSKGCYEGQADKDFTWRIFGSYMGDRYEMQAFFNNYNFLNKENGGITDTRFITDPASVQGGVTSVDPKAIPINLTNAHSRVIGHEFYLNQRYKVGYYHVLERDSIKKDSIIRQEYIPVTSFIWTLNYKEGKHLFLNSVAQEDTSFFKQTYLSLDGTNDETKYWKLSNTVGIQLLEGFHKYAKFGLAAYATYEIRKFTQTTDSMLRYADKPKDLTPFPDINVPHTGSENLLWVGGQLTKQKGSILTYNATAQFGLLGSVVGDVDVTGNVSTRFKLLGDSVRITGYGYFKNLAAPYLTRSYISNHFAWENDFGKTRRFKAGGELDIPHTKTNINAGFETMQNYIYFGNDGFVAQHSDNIQIFSATLKQNLSLGIFNWNNMITYQTSSNQSVLPLPKLALYSNMYLFFPIAKVLKVQVGVDCNYYTKYKAPAYNPATMTFHTQDEVELGNYPFMNVYANFKLDKVRFYLLYTHINQGWFSKDYFSVPNYPLNPGRLLLGVSVDFPN